MSCMSYLWNLNVISILLLCKETHLLSRLHCQTLLSDWLTFFFGNKIHNVSCKGAWVYFVYINNPLLVMDKIKLIESLRSTKRTTIRYKGLKIRLNGLQSLKSIRQLVFSSPLVFEGSSKLILSFKCHWNLTFSFFGHAHGT